MNWVDIVIAIMVLGLGFMGWRNGVIKLVFTLVGGIAGLVLAGRLFDDVAPAIPIGDKEGVQQLIAFALIVLVVMIVAWIAARIVKTVLTVLLLGWVDGLAGAVIGLVIGGIAATAFVSAAGIVPSDTVQEAVDESSLAEPLVDNMGFVYALLPEEFDDVKDLLDQGKDLFDQGKSLLDLGGDFLERSEQLKELLDEGGSLLERSDRLQELIDEGEGLLGSGSEFAMEWTGADDYTGNAIYVVFEPQSESAITIGPLSTIVGDDGTARLEVPDGIDGDTTYDIWYFADGNDNAICDEGSVDAKRHDTLEPGFIEISSGDLFLDIAGEGVCDHLS